MPVRRPTRKSLSRQVLESMESLIHDGEWSVGSRIPAEPELARMFEVSHNTVREAIQGLIHAGMLVARPGDGTYVTATDRLEAALDNRLRHADMERVLEARLAIEKAIVALAAHSRSESDLSAMQAALDKCKTRSGAGIDNDMAFHASIAAATRNPILCQIYRVIAGHLCKHFEKILTERQYDPTALALHDELLDCMRHQDATRAQDIVAKIVDFDTTAISPIISDKNHTAPQLPKQSGLDLINSLTHS